MKKCRNQKKYAKPKKGMWKTDREVGFYKNGLKQGTHITMWDGINISGRTSTSVDYVDDVKHGTYISMHSSGRIYRMTQYKHGKIDGTHIEFSYEQGFERINRCKIEKYVDGQKHGKSKTYFFKGKVEDAKFTLVSESEYVNGKKHGTETFFNEDGVLFSTARYSEGKQIGLEKYYYRSGTVKKVINYKEGYANGIVLEYREDGTVFRTCDYVDGVRNGREVCYSENGDVEKTDLYENGKFVSTEKTNLFI